MNKKIFFILYFLSVTCGAVDYGKEIPRGRYVGTGTWTALNDASGEYKITVDIGDNLIKIDHTGEDFSQSLSISYRFFSPFRFHMNIDEYKITGEGECIFEDDDKHCAIEFANYDNPNQLEGKIWLVFNYNDEPGKMVIKGDEELSGERIIWWEDTLQLENL